MGKKISKFKKYELTRNIPSYHLKRGMIFEWDEKENCFVTYSLPWYLTPLVTRGQIRRKMFRELQKIEK